jgi:predicted peptidase
MKSKMQGPLAVIAIILVLFACKKDIAPIPQERFTSKSEAPRPDSTASDSTASDTTVSDTTGNAADSIQHVADSIKHAADSLAALSGGANNIIETAPPVHTAVYMNVTGNIAGFWQSLPARYEQTTKSYPLIIFMHGVGELGTNLGRMNCCGLPRHLQTKTFPADFQVNGKHFSFIVMSPQFKRRPGAGEVQAVIDFAKKRFRVDASRIYVTGMSLGGGSTWDYAAAYGQNIAAAVPVCGGTMPTTSLASNIASKYLPVWTLHSSGDAVVPVQWAKTWINLIRQDNPSMTSSTRLTVWSNLTHNSTWAKAFNPATKVDGMNIYEWMLQYERKRS